MRFILVLVFVLALAPCDAAAHKRRAKKRQARAKASPKIPKILREGAKIVPQCAICTEHGSICSSPDAKPPVFKVSPVMGPTVLKRVVFGQKTATAAPMQVMSQKSVLVNLGDLKKFHPRPCPLSFSRECKAKGGESTCGYDHGLPASAASLSTYCSKPMVGSKCFMMRSGKNVPIGEECLPSEETCNAPHGTRQGDLFFVGPWQCRCGWMGLVAGSECKFSTTVIRQVGTSLQPDGSIDSAHCKDTCWPPTFAVGTTRRRRGMSGCLGMPRRHMCPTRVNLHGPQPPKLCALCTSGGSQCVAEDQKVEFLLVASKKTSGTGEPKGLSKEQIKIVEVQDGEQAPEEIEEMLEQVKKDSIVTESIQITSKMQIKPTNASEGEYKGIVLGSCKRALFEEEREMMDLCKKAGGSVRLEGCLDIFCSTPIQASKCLVNGKVAIPHEVCPGDASVFCAPGEYFDVGSYARCKCTNGIKALAHCQPMGHGIKLSAIEEHSAIEENRTSDFDSDEEKIPVPSVEAQLKKCSKHCHIELTMQGDKVIKSDFLGSLMQNTNKIRKSLLENSAEDGQEEQDSEWGTPPIIGERTILAKKPMVLNTAQLCKPKMVPVAPKPVPETDTIIEPQFGGKTTTPIPSGPEIVIEKDTIIDGKFGGKTTTPIPSGPEIVIVKPETDTIIDGKFGGKTTTPIPSGPEIVIEKAPVAKSCPAATTVFKAALSAKKKACAGVAHRRRRRRRRRSKPSKTTLRA